MKFAKKRSIARRNYQKRSLMITGAFLIILSGAVLFAAIISRVVAKNVASINPSVGVVGADGASISRAFDAAKNSASGSDSQKIAAAPPLAGAAQVEGVSTACKSNTTASQKYAASQSPMLQKYADYVALCGENTAKRLMFFAGMPATSAEAGSMAQDMAIMLKQFAALGIQPLVIVEPVAANEKLNIQAIRDGTYNAFFDQFFASLKQKGITDAQMGMWVPFPENNLAEWNNVDPDTFAANVTNYVGIQKKYFPKSQASIMLDAMTYKPLASGGFDDGAFISLAPYVKNIPKGLLTSFGFQGFPWAPAANSGSTDTNENADVFLQASLATEAASILGVKNIWVNTGTFSDYYTNDAAAKVHRTAAQRLQVFSTTARQLALIQNKGYTVSVNLFAQDKSLVGEAVNWSYWPAGQPTATSDAHVFVSFTNVLRKNKIDLWLFDVK